LVNTLKQRKIEIDSILYGLEQDYGLPAYYVEKSTTVDVDTGDQTINETTTLYSKAITFEADESYNINGLVDNQFSSQIEIGDRFFILRNASIPKLNDYLIFDGYKFNIVKWTILDARAGVLIQSRTVKEAEFTLTQSIKVVAYVNAS